MMKSYIFITISLSLLIGLQRIGHAEVIYDVERLALNRTKQYEIQPYQRIVIFTPPRTGSSLVYNIFRFLFEDESKLLSNHNEFDLDRNVLRTHRFMDIELLENKNSLYIFNLRNISQTCISHYRILSEKISDVKEFAKRIVYRHYNYLSFYEKMEKQAIPLIKLRYADFVEDIEVIFDAIEYYFDMRIDPKDKELMIKGFSKENIFYCIQDLKDFSKYLPISGFHGRHVILQDYTPSPEFLFWLNYYLEEAEEIKSSF